MDTNEHQLVSMRPSFCLGFRGIGLLELKRAEQLQPVCESIPFLCIRVYSCAFVVELNNHLNSYGTCPRTPKPLSAGTASEPTRGSRGRRVGWWEHPQPDRSVPPGGLPTDRLRPPRRSRPPTCAH